MRCLCRCRQGDSDSDGEETEKGRLLESRSSGEQQCGGALELVLQRTESNRCCN